MTQNQRTGPLTPSPWLFLYPLPSPYHSGPEKGQMQGVGLRRLAWPACACQVEKPSREWAYGYGYGYGAG